MLSELGAHKAILQKVKYALLNGDFRLGRLHLQRVLGTETKLRPIIKRYLAVIDFIEGNYRRSLEHLSIPELNSLPQFGKICLLKVLNQIVLDKKTDLERDWGRCKLENGTDLHEARLLWMETLIDLKLRPGRGKARIPFRVMRLKALDIEETIILMKLSLYLNQESLLEDQISDLTEEQISNTEIRELAGQILFRTGALARSYRFMETLSSPNAENVKGNLYLLRKKYELAYTQFKYALELKQNSQNALERLLPLAWLLGDWENGARYSERVQTSPETHINKLTLHSAFLIQKGDYEVASRTLEHISRYSNRGTELEVSQLSSFSAVMQNRNETARKDAFRSCFNYDIVNCWLLYQLNQWDSFPLTIRRDEKIPERREWEKLSKEELNEPLTETVFVNQLDIEELDDKLIQLVPKE